jgi:chlorophyllide a reductase subunit X
MRPTPLSQDGLLELFSSETTGRDFILTPATEADMCGATSIDKPSLEVVYDTV